MSRFMQTMIAAVAFATAVASAWSAEPTIDDLIKQLGSQERKVYKAAKKALIARGYAAYRPLSKVVTDDPEVKVAVKEIMDAVKYSIVPGAEGDVRQLFEALERNETGEAMWRAIAAKEPERIIDLIIEVGRDDKRAKELQHGIKAFLIRMRPYSAAAQLDTLPEADRKRFVQLLDDANREFYFSKKSQARLFYCMKDYRRAVSRASELWMAEGGDAGIELAAAAIAKSGDDMRFWAMGGRRIVTASSLSRRCRETAFFCHIANALNKRHLVEGFYDLGDVRGAPARPALDMYDFLVEFGDDDLVDDFLNAAQGPVLKYLLLHRFFKDAGGGIPDDELKGVVDSATGESELMELAQRVLTVDRKDASTVLNTVLSKAPFGSQFDAEAHYALGYMAWEEGRFKAAAEQFKKSVGIRASNGQSPRGKSLLLYASELEKMADLEDDAYTTLMAAGLNAELSGDVAAAEKSYRAAIAKDPKLACAHQRLIPMLSEQSRFKEMAALSMEMVQLEPPTTKDCLRWSLRAMQVAALDKADAWLKIYVEKDPAKANATYYEALLEERKGNFDEAAKRSEELLKKGYRYGNLRRILGLVRLKQRRLKDAESLLIEHMLEEPFDDYGRLTLSVARGLDGRDDREDVLSYIKTFNRSDETWSTWLLRHHAGVISADDLLKKARTMGSAHEQYGQECEASFVIGMRALIDGDEKTAKAYFKKTMDMQITVYVEHYWARDELKRLDDK